MSLIPGAVAEVGGPTILATLTVIAALLPMAFVSGLMGPYMGPIPINASLGMAISLAIAFVLTPWLAARLLKSHALLPTSAVHATMRIASSTRCSTACCTLRSVAAGAACCGRPWRRGLIALDAAAGARRGGAEDAALRQQERVPGGCRSAGRQPGRGHGRCAAPVCPPRHRPRGGAPAGIRRHGLAHQLQRSGAPVRAAPKPRAWRPAGQPRWVLPDRKLQSHAIATRGSRRFDSDCRAAWGRLKVVEVPPGPPVLAPLVAEVYGPDAAGCRAVAAQVREALAEGGRRGGHRCER